MAKKIEEQLYNLYTKSNVIIKDITANTSIDDFIELLGIPNYTFLVGFCYDCYHHGAYKVYLFYHCKFVSFNRDHIL